MTLTALTHSRFTDFAVLITVALLCSWAVFYDGYPIGDDYKNQIIAFEAFREQLDQGEIYPRWLSDINHGFGGANLFFYPPLIYYVEYAIGSALPAGTATTTILAVSSALFLILSGLSCYAWLSSLMARPGALAGAALYMAAPYHLFIDLYERNNGAEFAVYAWVPLLFLFAQTDGRSRALRAAKLAAVYTLFVLTHLPSAVFVIPFAGLWALLYAAIRHEGPRPALTPRLIQEGAFFTACVGLGSAMAGLYLVPALTLLDLVRSHVLWSGLFYDYKNWFIWSGTRCPAAYNDFCILMTFVVTGTIFAPVAGYFLLCKQMRSGERRCFAALAFLAGSCFFLMTPLSSLIWDALTPLQKIQFPFRLMVLGDLLYAGMAGLLFSLKAEKARPIMSAAACGGMLLVMAALTLYTARYVQQSWHPDKAFFDFRIEKRILTGEFFPNNPEMTVKIPDFVEQTPEIPLARTEPATGISAALAERTSRRLVFEVHANTPGVLLLRQFYMRGWTAHVLRKGAAPEAAEIKASEPYGQISVDLPQGSYQLTVALPILRQEQAGGFLSLGGFIVFFMLCASSAIFRAHAPARDNPS